MTLQQLRCFEAVAQTMSFARAAQRLYLSQPAVSHHIRTLESELGVTLVERSLHHVALTPAGERFYLETTDMLSQLDLAVRRLRGNEGEPEILHIGFGSTIQIHRLPQILREFHRECPDVCLFGYELSLSEQKQFFRDGRIDIMFSGDHAATLPDAAFEPLFENYFCCVMPLEHPLAGRSSVCLEELNSETFILLEESNCQTRIDALQREIRMKCYNSTLYYSTSSRCTIPMIEAGLGVAVMPSFVVPEGSQVVRVPLETRERAVCGIVWRRSSCARKVRLFVDITRSLYA